MSQDKIVLFSKSGNCTHLEYINYLDVYNYNFPLVYMYI